MGEYKKKSLGINATLNIIKQLMAILFPVITVSYASRALGQEQFGVINYSRSVVSYFSLFAALGISTYAIREGAYLRTDKVKYEEFASQIFTINILSTAFSFLWLILFVLKSDVFVQYRVPMIVFGVSFVLQTFGADWVNSTYEDFKYITIRYCFFNFVSVILLVLFVHNQNDGLLYSGILVLASSGGNILNIFYIRRYVHLRFSPSLKCIQHLQPIFLLFSIEIATSIYINSDTTMLGTMVSNTAVAIYTVASNIYIAVKRVSNAAVTVALPRLSYYIGTRDKIKYKNTVDSIINLVITLILPCLIGVFVLSENLMIIMGGRDYAEGAVALRILSIALIFAVFAFLLSRCILLPFKEDRTYMMATIISAVINIGLNLSLIPRYSFSGAALTTLISEAIVCTIMFIKANSLVKISFETRDILKTLISCIPISTICLLCKYWFDNDLVAVLSSFFFSVVAFGASLYGLKHSLVVKCFIIIKKYTGLKRGEAL